MPRKRAPSSKKACSSTIHIDQARPGSNLAHISHATWAEFWGWTQFALTSGFIVSCIVRQNENLGWLREVEVEEVAVVVEEKEEEEEKEKEEDSNSTTSSSWLRWPSV